MLPPILGGLQLSASQFIDKLSEVRDVLGETAGSTDDLDLAQARAEATSSQLADAQERLSAANADLIATQDAINEGMLQGSEASTAQSAALERQTVAEGEVRDATLANSEAQGKLAESEVAAADTGVLQDERLIKVGKLVTYAFLGIGAAVVGISVKMAMSFQSSQAKVQAALGQSVKQSNALANSLLGTAGHTEQSASAMEAALAPVAAQFKSLQGGAYTTADALEEMKAASTLADAGLGSLSDTTGDLAGIMQAFQLRAKDAASTADILYSASQLTGQGIDSLTSGLERTRTKLGALAPSLGDLSGLLADMTEHGETGRAAMSMLTTTMTALLKPTAAAAKAQTDLKATLDAMPPSLRALADEYQSGALTGNSLTAATDGMSTANAALWKAFVSAAGGARTSNLASKELGLTVLNNKGQFVGMASVIGQLQEKLKGLTNAQATAELTALGFGSSSAKLLALVRAGPEAFDKATAAVTKHGRAENAANLQMKTLHGQLHMLEAAVDDYGVRLGRVLIPKIETVIHVTASVVEWFNKNRVAAYTLAAVVVGVLGVAVTAFAVNALGKLVKNAQAAYQMLMKLFGVKGAPSVSTALTDDATKAGDVLKASVAEVGQQLIADAQSAAAALETGGTATGASIETGSDTGRTALETGGDAAGETLESSSDAAREALETGGDTGGAGLESAADASREALETGGDTGGAGLESAADASREALETGGDTSRDAMETGGDTARGALETGADTSRDALETGADTARGALETGGDVAGGDMEAGADTARGALETGGDVAGADMEAGGAAGSTTMKLGAAAFALIVTTQLANWLNSKLANIPAVKKTVAPGFVQGAEKVPVVGPVVQTGADVGALMRQWLGVNSAAMKAATTGTNSFGGQTLPTQEALETYMKRFTPESVAWLSGAVGTKKEREAGLAEAKGLALNEQILQALAKVVDKVDKTAPKWSGGAHRGESVDVGATSTAVNTLTATVRSVRPSNDRDRPVSVSGDLHTTITLDGRTLAQALRPYQLSAARATGQNVLNSRSVGRGTGNP
jgi:sulfite exporter TauE/SafE